MSTSRLNIGFVATRLARTDGVSLEAAKWRDVLTGLGHECFCFAGDSDWPPERSYHVPEAHFQHPAISQLNSDLFGTTRRSEETSQVVQRLKAHLKSHLHAFVRRFGIDLLIAENALSLPMNVPLGLALTEFIAETNMPAIGHHHDFAWERTRYAINAAADYLRAAFPPALPCIRHVVISSYGASQLALRTSMGATLIPNVMDFDHPPAPPDDYAADLRASLGLTADEYLLLQPTRVVPRKRVERAIELARQLDVKCALVVSHAAGDEGYAYDAYVRNFANIMGVRLLYATARVDHARGTAPDGSKVYSLADLYQKADLVTYLSAIEGFGNAFLECVYYRRPMVVGGYDIFKTDIQPKGFRVVEVDEFVDPGAVEHARRLLQDRGLVNSMTEHNYALGRRYYSYTTLERHLAELTAQCCPG
jgi:glycosyltransferase involved in cell wall biosynthesis